MPSFVSERTIEFSLIRELEKYKVVGCKSLILFYYWKTREGTKYSKKCFLNRKLKVIAFYPRRPKPLKDNKDLIEIKFHGIVLSEASI